MGGQGGRHVERGQLLVRVLEVVDGTSVPDAAIGVAFESSCPPRSRMATRSCGGPDGEREGGSTRSCSSMARGRNRLVTLLLHHSRHVAASQPHLPSLTSADAHQACSEVLQLCGDTTLAHLSTYRHPLIIPELVARLRLDRPYQSQVPDHHTKA